MPPPAHHLKGIAQWQKEVEDHIPGLKVSNLPCLFVVPVTLDAGRKTKAVVNVDWTLSVSQRDQWQHIPEVLRELVSVTQKDWTPPEGWSYAAAADHAAPGETPHPMDLPNPRHYTLEGWQVFREWEPRYIAKELERQFKEGLAWRWQPGSDRLLRNKRRASVLEYLGHHHLGGNPEAFRDFIREIEHRPESMPPATSVEQFLPGGPERNSTGGKLEDPQGLARVLKEWRKSLQPRKMPRMDPQDKDHPAFQPSTPKRSSPYFTQQMEREGSDPAPFVPEQVATDADTMEAKAREQYTEACRGYFPGFAFSDHPANFVVNLAYNKEGRERAKERGNQPKASAGTACRSVWPMCMDESRWDKIREHLLGYPDPYAAPIIPKGWSYAALVGDAKPHRFDLKNPRLYTLEGRLVPWGIPNHRELARRYTGNPYGHFPSRLVDVFMEAVPNDREAEVVAFMEHHRTKGGNPEALANYVDGLLEKWRADPPKRTNIQRFVEGPQPIPEHGIFIRALERWLADARKAPATANGTDKVKSTRPDLKLLALVHAMRYLTGEKGANIAQANAQALAINAGSKGKDAGRDLRRHYERYTMGKDRHAQRLDDGKHYTVRERYLSAIEMLEGYSMAKAMAEAELEELRERE